MNFKKIIFSVIILLSIVGIYQPNLYAYTVNSGNKTITTDGSESDTSSAITYAEGLAQDGWTIIIGTSGGNYTWNTELVWGPNNTMTLEGATGGITINGNGIPYIIFFGGWTPKFSTLGPNITFGTAGSGVSGALVCAIGQGCSDRITGCNFIGAASPTPFVVQWGDLEGGDSTTPILGPYGIIDHCNFSLPGGAPYNCINVSCNGHANVPQTGWVSPMSWGTTNVLCVENCTFLQPSTALTAAAVMESDDSARWCFRYNNVTNFCLSWHGTNSGGKSSTLQTEIYNNNFYCGLSGAPAFLFRARGGTSVIFSNIVINNGGVPSAFYSGVEECAETNGSPPVWQQETCPAQLFYPANYVANQQIGQGSSTNGITWQSLWPTYIWSNNIPSGMVIQLGLDGGDSPFIQQGRDIYTNQAMPNYVPLSYPNPLISGGSILPPFLFINSKINNSIFNN